MTSSFSPRSRRSFSCSIAVSFLTRARFLFSSGESWPSGTDDVVPSSANRDACAGVAIAAAAVAAESAAGGGVAPRLGVPGCDGNGDAPFGVLPPGVPDPDPFSPLPPPAFFLFFPPPPPSAPLAFDGMPGTPAPGTLRWPPTRYLSLDMPFASPLAGATYGAPPSSSRL